jgi:hypothetical protein
MENHRFSSKLLLHFFFAALKAAWYLAKFNTTEICTAYRSKAQSEKIYDLQLKA